MKAIPSTVSSMECVTRIDCCASGARTARASSARSAACGTRARGGVRCSGHTALAAAHTCAHVCTRVRRGGREGVKRGHVLCNYRAVCARPLQRRGARPTGCSRTSYRL
eukprot:4305389-Prymnesium_polylepis.1